MGANTIEKNADDRREVFQAYEQGHFEQIVALHEKDWMFDSTSTLTKAQQEKVVDWFTQDLIVARNLNWLPKMKQEMTQQSTLFAVGTGHLMGNYGLIELLRRDGYTITPEPKLLIWQ